MLKNSVITLDGPAGSGKSSVAGVIAQKLNYLHADSGACYRTITLALMRRLGECDSPEAFGQKVAENPVKFEELECSFTASSALQVNQIKGEDVGDEIRTPAVTGRIRYIADSPAYRSAVNSEIRKLSSQTPLVVDGRDVGTVIFPDSSYKFYLDAAPEVRARRRLSDFQRLNPNKTVDLAELTADIIRRDNEDKNRQIGALALPEDAILIDTSELELKAVVSLVLSHLQIRF